MILQRVARYCLTGILIGGMVFANLPANAAGISPLYALTLQLDGEDDFATAPDHPSLDLGMTGDFTIEGFFFIANPVRQDKDVLVWKEGAYELALIYGIDTPDKIIFTINTSLTTTVFVLHTMELTSGWHHIAAIYDDEYDPAFDLLALFMDGTRVKTLGDFDISGIPDSPAALMIGGNAIANSASGWFEEIRLSKVARYVNNFNIPISPFALDDHSVALWHFDEPWGVTTFQDASPYKNTLVGLHDAQIGNPTGIVPPPLPFSKIYPPDQATEISIHPTLTWETSIGATNYEICLEADGNYVCDEPWINAGTGNSFSPSTLDAYTQYHWQVRAKNLSDTILEADGGAWLSFITEDIPQPGPLYTVTHTEDTNDGTCGVKHCTLREAVIATETDDLASTIELQPESIYTLHLAHTDPDFGASAFTITSNALTIEGHGAVIERDPSLVCDLDGSQSPGEFRIFLVTSLGNLTFNQVTLRNGCSDGAAVAGSGAAVYNRGVLASNQTTMEANHAWSGGGAIFNGVDGNLLVENSTLAGNDTRGGGGGLLNIGFASFLNSTVSNNRSAEDGGGVYNINEGEINLIFSTIAENSSGGDGGGLANQAGGTLEIQNSLAGNNADQDSSALDCTGEITSQGYNLVEETTGCALSFLPTDIVGAEPYLLPLFDNGGFTQTHALWSLSPAIDKIPEFVNGCNTTIQSDQRGLLRPQDAQFDGLAACDIGAIEMLAGSINLYHVFLPAIANNQ